MTPIALEQISAAVGGQLAPTRQACAPISSICTNSRLMHAQSLFVALRGDRFDGHDFLSAAAAEGAVAALVDHRPADAPDNLRYIQVPDTRRALGKLAQFVRMGLAGKVVDVAGSNGKTGTKHLIDAALQTKLIGSISPKSYNNDIGVPLTIFAAEPTDDYLVLELGTNHHGEISWLTEISRPDVAVITNCSAEHLEGLSDLAGVRRENAGIILGLSREGLLVVNGDDPDLLEAVSGYPGNKVTFGFASTNNLWASEISCGANGTRFRLNDGAQVFVPLLGRHTAANALAAIAVGRQLGVGDEQIITGLATATGAEMRLQLRQMAGVSVLNDAYNANPASMRAALETLRVLPTAGRRIAVLGDMRELGVWTEKCHRDVGHSAARCSLDQLVCVGPHAALIGVAAAADGMNAENITCYPDAQSAAIAVAGTVSDGDLILLKASRAIGLERVGEEIARTRKTTLKAAG